MSHLEPDPREARPGGALHHTAGDLGVRIGGATHSYGLPVLYGSGIPPYPGMSVVAPAFVPSPDPLPSDEQILTADEKAAPQQIDRDVITRDLVRRLMQVYIGIYKARLAVETCWSPSDKHLTEPKLHPAYERIAAAADLLRSKGIAPAAWVAWSVDVYRHYVTRGSGKMPPISWVYSADRIAENSGWFGHEYGAYAGGRAIFGKTHRALIDRYMLLQAALINAGTDQEKRAAVVSQYFPPGLYDRMVVEARGENEAIEEDLHARIGRGVFVW